MSADIQKEAIFDSRLIQSRPRFAVSKGALSLTNAPFSAIAATSSQLTFNVYVPSENVFCDRKMDWTGTINLSVDVQLPPSPAGTPILEFGADCAISPFPLNSICSTISSSINDTTSVINTQDVLKEVLRLTDYKSNRVQRTTPTMLDKYQCYDDCYGANNNTLGGYDSSSESAEVPNGAYPGVAFTDNAGGIFRPTSATTLVATGLAGYTNYNVTNGVAVTTQAYGTSQQYRVCFSITSTEPLVLSPFVFADHHEWDTGLFGINNIQLVMNLQSSVARVLRTTSRTGKLFSNITFNPLAVPWSVARVNVQFLTPSLDVPLPAKSCVPYFEFPRYISQPTQTPIPAGSVSQLMSQTITLPTIPDLLIIYVKASGSTGGFINNGVAPSNYADFYLPVASLFNSSTPNPLSISFDNFSGLLSSHTAEELYGMAVKNGLEMDWAEWSGAFRANVSNYALSPVPGAAGDQTQTARVPGQLVPSVGSILVLKPSQDITLQAGQSCSLVGNFTLQFQLSIFNNTAYAVTPTIYTITANSGFLESIRGSSRIIKGVLSEQDIINAPIAPEGTRTGLERHVGGISFGSLGNVLSRAKKIYEASKPAISAVRSAVDAAPGIMSAVRGDGTGAGTGGRRGHRGLAARLM